MHNFNSDNIGSLNDTEITLIVQVHTRSAYLRNPM